MNLITAFILGTILFYILPKIADKSFKFIYKNFFYKG